MDLIYFDVYFWHQLKCGNKFSFIYACSSQNRTLKSERPPNAYTFDLDSRKLCHFYCCVQKHKRNCLQTLANNVFFIALRTNPSREDTHYYLRYSILNQHQRHHDSKLFPFFFLYFLAISDYKGLQLCIYICGGKTYVSARARNSICSILEFVWYGKLIQLFFSLIYWTWRKLSIKFSDQIR